MLIDTRPASLIEKINVSKEAFQVSSIWIDSAYAFSVKENKLDGALVIFAG
jgi:hypothetical protein